MSTAVRQALYGKMAGDGTLTAMLGTAPSGQSVYYQQAPSGADFPYVIFQQESGVPITYGFGNSGTTDVANDELWMIKGVYRAEGSGSADVADGIASRLDALLTDGTISISGRTQCYLRRESDLPSYSETVDGQRYIHSGALFRLIHR